jgi:hypothetical protein
MISKDFDITHIDLINTKIEYKDLNVLKAETYSNYELGDKAKTYIADDRVIFACGIKIVREGVGHCWVIPSVYVDSYARSFYKEIKNLLDTYSLTMNLHRIQTTIQDPFVSWIESLGFKRESILRQITADKEDEYMYVKFY